MLTEYPFLGDAFYTRWSELSADHVVADIQQAIEKASQLLASIEALDDKDVSYANTFEILELAGHTVGDPWHKVDLLSSLNDHPALREAQGKALPAVTQFFSNIPLNPVLYDKLQNAAKLPESASLSAVQKRFVEETLKDFKDAGADASPEQRQRLKEIAQELSQKTKKFSENVLDSTNAYEKLIVDASELDGLPKSILEKARLDALAKGHGSEDKPVFRITLQAPSLQPVLRYAHNTALRKELTEAFFSVANERPYDNTLLIREIIALRREQAQILGQASFPDWILSRRMAKNAQTALGFIEDLHARTANAYQRETADILAFKESTTGESDEALLPWDAAYWSERLRKDRFAYDEEELRPYFSLDAVQNGLFELAGALFNINIAKLDPQPQRWDPAVEVYTVHDRSSGRHLGSFYTDWFPRENKRSGAWMSDMRSGTPQEDGHLSPHCGLIAGNMNAPVGDKPALLTHGEVETVFHEFGHLIHHLLSTVPIRSLSGTNVAWDFVELPSQIMENWCWEKESLDLFARHYETGEPIPDELFKKLVSTRQYGAARHQMRQLEFGKMDMALHLYFDTEKDDLDDFLAEQTKGYRQPRVPGLPSLIRFFSHLFGSPVGYASGYYSYKWAEVLDADAFTRFKKEGLLNASTGKDFRDTVLANGNAVPPEDLYRAFMGRDPQPDPLLERIGLLAPTNP
jgi:oligopeptidase A